MNLTASPVVFSLAALPLIAALGVGMFLSSGEDPDAARYAGTLAFAYLLGSIPWGYILMRFRSGQDIREYGSGRVGMSNVLRTGGGKIAAVVLALDTGKGALAVALAHEALGSAGAEVAAGLLVLVGHNWPVFLRFRGGRGVLTGLGGLAVMAPIAAGIAAFSFVPIALLSRYLSLGSMLGVVAGFAAMLALGLAGVYSITYVIYGSVGCCMILWQHRDNIQRIRQGNERRLGQPARRTTAPLG